MTTLATLKRLDGATAQLRADYTWVTEDRAWAELLNAGFDPTLDYESQPAGLPSYVQTVERAAAKFGCEATYPWSDSPAQEGIVH